MEQGGFLKLLMLKIIFFGTPEYTLCVLKELTKSFKAVAVVTQKPKPVGRKQTVVKSPVEQFVSGKIPVFYDFKNLPKADLGVLASFGKIIPEKTLKHFPLGIINIHPSLLPKLRGPSPVQSTIITAEKPGVTIIKLDKKMDHGPILAQYQFSMGKKIPTTQTLRELLFELSSQKITKVIKNYKKGKIKLKQQNHESATYCTLIKKDHAFVPWEKIKSAIKPNQSPVDNAFYPKAWSIPFIKNYQTTFSPLNIHRFICAMYPWPVAWTKVKIKKGMPAKRLKIIKSSIQKTDNNQGVKLILNTVQLEGKKPVSQISSLLEKID